MSLVIGDRQSVTAVLYSGGSQPVHLLMVFAHWLIPAHGALGAAQDIWQLISSIFLFVVACFYSG